MKERVILPNVRMNPVTKPNATMDYVGSMSSNAKLLLVENEQMEKNLQETRKKAEKSVGSAMAEMTRGILANVSTLEATMWKLYDRFVTIHKEVVHLFGFQRQRKNILQTLRGIQTAIDHVQEWIIRYKGVSLHFLKMMKLQVELDKPKIKMHIQNSE